MPTARDRQKRRRKEREMARKSGTTNSQAAPESNIKLPEIRIPGAQWLIIIPAAGLIFIAVVLALRFINPPDTSTPPNAIWLNSDWAYGEPSAEEILQLAVDLQQHDIGSIYLYTSSLLSDGSWSGLATGNNNFSEVESRLQDLIEELRDAYPNVELYAWIEVNAQSPEYRLDRPQTQNAIANFSADMINDLAFDGILLDIIPIFVENEDYIQVLRTVKQQIGLDTELIVAVPPDLTPTGTDLNLPAVIAPGTEWSSEYKQRVALLANQIVIKAYNSYLTNPVDYIEWVSYQVGSYVDVLSELGTNTTIMLSVPNYSLNSQAHDPNIESLAAGLDGAVLAREALDETTRGYLSGVAVFTDRILSDQDWTIYQQRWSR